MLMGVVHAVWVVPAGAQPIAEQFCVEGAALTNLAKYAAGGLPPHDPLGMTTGKGAPVHVLSLAVAKRSSVRLQTGGVHVHEEHAEAPGTYIGTRFAHPAGQEGTLESLRTNSVDQAPPGAG
jgi:hypothetical protein